MDAQVCCQPYHAGDKTPVEAEALMRARFSAYVKKDADFLVSHLETSQRNRLPEALTTRSGTA